MQPDILAYNQTCEPGEQAICKLLADAINEGLPGAEAKIWHGHPVWFLNGNPVVGYSQQKRGLRLMFWSGFRGSPAERRGRKIQGRVGFLSARHRR